MTSPRTRPFTGGLIDLNGWTAPDLIAPDDVSAVFKKNRTVV
jgi:hypothetical protein